MQVVMVAVVRSLDCSKVCTALAHFPCLKLRRHAAAA